MCCQAEVMTVPAVDLFVYLASNFAGAALWPLSMTAEFSNAPTSRAEVRVPRTDAAGMVDAMIDALFPLLSGASVLGLPTLALASLLQT